MSHPLDDPIRSALLGPQARFAEQRGGALRYQADVVPFATLPADPEPADWADLARLAGPGATVALAGFSGPPDGWQTRLIGDLVQLTGADVAGEEPRSEVIELGPVDVPDMLDLVARTQPGPFLTRTIELGRYLGLRRDGALVAMAGERLRPPGFTEISAVCTDAAWRGHGLATHLMRVLAASIRARGDTPFLHAVATNTGAIRLYEAMGFRRRQQTVLQAFTSPAAEPAAAPAEPG
jgi:ribosomal protein S18 acetylase RimI-like enzyme